MADTTFNYRPGERPSLFNAMFRELGALLRNFQRRTVSSTEGVYRIPSSGIQLQELTTDPAAPDAGEVIVYARATGGKTELCARFATGAIQQLAIEP